MRNAIESMHAHVQLNSCRVCLVGMSVPMFAMWIAVGSMHFVAQLNNCRVCKHVCMHVCNVSCQSIHACLCAVEQLIGFVSMSVPRFAMYLCMALRDMTL